MKIYLRSTSCLSPQETFGPDGFDLRPIHYESNFLKAREPVYESLLDSKLIRRMSRVIRMGAATAITCLRKGGISDPDAIIVGTAYGCLEDTEIFLTRFTEQGEQALSPTAFIHSTHNTVAAQIALILKCHAYNNTFVHRGFSFESALLDGMMLLEQKEATNVLVGGIDELTPTSFAILSRFGLYKNPVVSSPSLYPSTSAGTIAGEGAAFFLLAAEPSSHDDVCLEGLSTFYKPATVNDIKQKVVSFITDSQRQIADIDLVIAGRNGDKKNDGVYDALQHLVFRDNPIINYKWLCGEYPTSASFAMWLAANILREGKPPAGLGYNSDKPVKKILIYNHYLGVHHALMLLSSIK